MRRFVFSSLVVSSLTFLVSSTAFANLLVVDLKTNYRPGAEFNSARAILTPGGTQNMPVFTTSRVEEGVRIAEYSGLGNGRYELVVQLLRSDESILDTRRSIVTLDTNLAVTALVSRPDDRGELSIEPTGFVAASAPVYLPPPHPSTPPSGTPPREESPGEENPSGENPAVSSSAVTTVDAGSTTNVSPPPNASTSSEQSSRSSENRIEGGSLCSLQKFGSAKASGWAYPYLLFTALLILRFSSLLNLHILHILDPREQDTGADDDGRS